jgi:hypothetical protein
MCDGLCCGSQSARTTREARRVAVSVGESGSAKLRGMSTEAMEALDDMAWPGARPSVAVYVYACSLLLYPSIAPRRPVSLGHRKV